MGYPDLISPVLRWHLACFTQDGEDHLIFTGPNEVAAPDFGHFRDTLNSHFYPARVEALDRDPDMRDPWLSAIHLTLTTIGYVRFGTTASVDPGDLSAYHVNVVLSGTVASQCGDQQAIASPQVAAVFSPDRHTQLPRWDADAAQLSIKFPRTQVEHELAGLLGRPVVKPIDFRLALPVDEGPAAAGRRSCRPCCNRPMPPAAPPNYATSNRSNAA